MCRGLKGTAVHVRYLWDTNHGDYTGHDTPSPFASRYLQQNPFPPPHKMKLWPPVAMRHKQVDLAVAIEVHGRIDVADSVGSASHAGKWPLRSLRQTKIGATARSSRR